MVDYSKLDGITLGETDLFSSFSVELKEFVQKNNIRDVRSFVECIENNSYTVTTYKEILLEARGIVDLIKNKYLGIDLSTDIYLDKPIHNVSFYIQIWDSKIEILGVRISNNNKITLYSLINRLGFNDKERYFIMDSNKDVTEGKTIIDLLANTYDIVFNKVDKTPEDRVFCNKIKIILNYYRKKKADKKCILDEIDEKKFMGEVDKKIEQLERLLSKRALLDDKINELLTRKKTISDEITDLHNQLVTGNIRVSRKG